MVSTSKNLDNVVMEWNFEKLLHFCENEDRVINFLKQKGLIKENRKCAKCDSNMRQYGGFWRCNKKIKTKKGTKRCGRKVSIRKCTWFGKTKLEMKKVLTLSYMLIHNYEPKKISTELGISEVTVLNWSHFVKQVLVGWLIFESQPVGGPGRKVEINESKFGKRKYNRGHAVEGQWVFGGVERETQKVFLVCIPDRSSETLIPIIKKWILPGTTIISDCWRACNPLGEEGYEHLRINHSLNFVYPDPGSHTNAVESVWRHVKAFMPSNFRKKDSFDGYLAHYSFNKIMKERKIDLFEAFLNEIAKINFDCEGESLDEI